MTRGGGGIESTMVWRLASPRFPPSRQPTTADARASRGRPATCTGRIEAVARQASRTMLRLPRAHAPKSPPGCPGRGKARPSRASRPARNWEAVAARRDGKSLSAPPGGRPAGSRPSGRRRPGDHAADAAVDGPTGPSAGRATGAEARRHPAHARGPPARESESFAQRGGRCRRCGAGPAGRLSTTAHLDRARAPHALGGGTRDARSMAAPLPEFRPGAAKTAAPRPPIPRARRRRRRPRKLVDATAAASGFLSTAARLGHRDRGLQTSSRSPARIPAGWALAVHKALLVARSTRQLIRHPRHRQTDLLSAPDTRRSPALLAGLSADALAHLEP